MNLETRARDAVLSLRTATPVDVEHMLPRLHRTHRLRTMGKLIAAVVIAAVGFGVVQGRVDREAPPVSPFSKWVLVTASGIGGADNPVQPDGDEWAEPLREHGVQSYPNFRSADPATGRFLVQNMEATAWLVMMPGRREPLATIYADFGAALGPGPDEVTAFDSNFENVVVVGPDGRTDRVVGRRAADGLSQIAGWSADGETWAEIRGDHGRHRASLALVLRQPNSAEETTLFEHSEAAPPWYDAEEHRYADWPGAFNDWDAPRMLDLRWAPDSTRLAFVTMTTPMGQGGGRRVEFQLLVADATTGHVEPIADLGRCAEPVDENGVHAGACNDSAMSLAWTPDGEALTVLTKESLTTYDLTGKVLSSESSDLHGPIVWMDAQ